MDNSIQFIPINAQEHDNVIRAIVVAHMQRNGDFGGNPTQWVVTATHEAFQKGFMMGFNAGRLQAQQQHPHSRRERQQVADALPPGFKRLPR